MYINIYMYLFVCISHLFLEARCRIHHFCLHTNYAQKKVNNFQKKYVGISIYTKTIHIYMCSVLASAFFF